MTTHPTTITLVATDGGPHAARAIELAAALCTARAKLGDPSELHIVSVLDYPPPTVVMGLVPVVGPDLDIEVTRHLLDDAAVLAAKIFDGRIGRHLLRGDPWREIVGLAASLDADLIVVGTAGRVGLERILLGSVAAQVVRHAGCPVLVARPKDHHHLAAELGVPILPACADCVVVREQTSGQRQWCDRHSTKHVHGHLRYEFPPTFAMGSMNFRPND